MAAQVVSICGQISGYGWILFVFFGFFGDFVAGLGNVLASAFDSVAGSQDGGCAAEDDEQYEGHSQFASHK
jgi:hypothetical protein